ncbi:hypothetical protein BGY98DRAFT_303426 [Russula aff. rugulosa BPL654]|nr:hypothetical protein BGY98DRAFT_303426 [Russula aff. rugulosa BPL654]
MVSNVFDKLSSCSAVNDHGKAYQYRAIELIKICRLFSTASHQSPKQDDRLQSVLKVCDEALDHAVKSRTKKLGTTDDRFDYAIRKLHEYEGEFHKVLHKHLTVKSRMIDAEKKDKKNGRKAWISETDKAFSVVRFHILRSPSDKNPTVVDRPLICTSESKLSDILWVFSHYVPPPKKPKDPEGKRYLTLAQNPTSMMVRLYFRPHVWTRLRPSRLRTIRARFVSSLIMSTEYFWSLTRSGGGLLTASGRRTIFLFSKTSPGNSRARAWSENVSLTAPSPGLA